MLIYELALNVFMSFDHSFFPTWLPIALVEDDEESCMSCLNTTKYPCLCCKFLLCHKCSLPEENNDMPGWKAGKIVCLALKKPSSKAQNAQHMLLEEMAGRERSNEKGLNPPLGK